MRGYLRKNGEKGIRNIVLVVYLVECAHHVAEQIVQIINHNDVQCIGFSGCAPNAYATQLMGCICTHANVGGVLLVSLGCENLDRDELARSIAESGRAVQTIVIQESRGTKESIRIGVATVQSLQEKIKEVPVVPFYYSDLVVGTVCGGSDAMSGFTANPVVGMVFDDLIHQKATCIFEESGELIGCEKLLAARAISAELANHLTNAIHKAASYYEEMGHDSFSMGNAVGGLTTIEEKSLGSYCKSGSAPICGIINPGEKAITSGLYFMDVVPDGKPLWGFPNINDIAEMIEMIASGAHLILFTTGRGSVAGVAISPVIKICANPYVYDKLADDMDINAGKLIQGKGTIRTIADEVIEYIEAVCSSMPTKPERNGHQEFVLGYKSFEKKCEYPL